MNPPRKMTLQQRLDAQHAKAATHLAARAAGRRPVEAVADLAINLATRIAQLEAERDANRAMMLAQAEKNDRLTFTLEVRTIALSVIADGHGKAARIAREALGKS